MELKDILESGKHLYEMENPKKPSNMSERDPLQKIGKEKVESLKNSIKEIEFLIKQREALSETLSRDVEKIKTEIENFLLTTTAKDSEGFKERGGLRQKQIDVSELQLNERVNCWRDVATLKKELRERQKELSEKEDRINMFDKILE
ncbi:MAG: hypothetical protein AABW81_01495 [Nanoarchaeota archaeon]